KSDRKKGMMASSAKPTIATKVEPRARVRWRVSTSGRPRAQGDEPIGLPLQEGDNRDEHQHLPDAGGTAQLERRIETADRQRSEDRAGDLPYPAEHHHHE